MVAAQLIFDLDGTISDPQLGIGRSLNYALASFDLATVDDAFVAASIGPPLDDAFRRAVPNADNGLITALVAKYRERYAEIGYAENSLYPGMAAVLRHLAEHARLGVCTSKREDFAQRILKLFEIDAYFEFVSGGDIGIAKSEQLSQLHVQGGVAQHALMIGDRAVDVAAAHANGLAAVGVLWGYGSIDELQEAGADRLISSVEELAELI